MLPLLWSCRSFWEIKVATAMKQIALIRSSKLTDGHSLRVNEATCQHQRTYRHNCLLSNTKLILELESHLFILHKLAIRTLPCIYPSMTHTLCIRFNKGEKTVIADANYCTHLLLDLLHYHKIAGVVHLVPPS